MKSVTLPKKMYDTYPHVCGLFGFVFIFMNQSPFISIFGFSLLFYWMWVVKKRIY